MQNSFDIKFIDVSVKELNKIGFDKSYANYGAQKHMFSSVKILNLSCAQANILKQTAISVGTDCAVHKEVITGNVDRSDCILSGSVNELTKIAQKLCYQPFGLKRLGEQIIEALNHNLASISVRDKSLNFNVPLIMGILNVTPDSFSDGGQFNTLEAAIDHYKQLVIDGADIVDIGGESTKPYSDAVSQEEEVNRVIPVIKAIRKIDEQTIISIDTRNAVTAGLALQAGADIVNDVSSLEWDDKMIDVVKRFNCPVILTHSSGSPDVMQKNTQYVDVVDEIYLYFKNKIEALVSQGVSRSKLIIDPGIGFGKTPEQNLEIVKRIKELGTLGLPILVGHSRKSFLSEMVNSTDDDVLDDATLLLSYRLIHNGVNILRVHNVKKHSIIKVL